MVSRAGQRRPIVDERRGCDHASVWGFGPDRIREKEDVEKWLDGLTALPFDEGDFRLTSSRKATRGTNSGHDDDHVVWFWRGDSGDVSPVYDRIQVVPSATVDPLHYSLWRMRGNFRTRHPRLAIYFVQHLRIGGAFGDRS